MPEGFLIHSWTRGNRILLAGRLSNGESFAAALPREAKRRFIPDPDGDWQSFEGQRLSCLAGSQQGMELPISASDEFLLFQGIKGSLEIRGRDRPGRRVDRVFLDPQIHPSSRPPKAVWMSLDIETDKAGSVVATSLVQGERELVLFLGPSLDLDYVESFKDERHLLEALSQRIQEWDPDIITGWNILDFDFPLLWKRYQAQHIPMDFGRAEDELCQMKTLASGQNKLIIPGRQALDAMRVVRGSGRSFDDMRLETVAQEVLGRGKLVSELGLDKVAELERLRRQEPESFCAYSLEDSRLVLELLDALGLDHLTLARAQVTGSSLELAWTSIPTFERIYGMELIKRNILPPARDPDAEVSGAAGGTVLEPVPGYFDNVLVFDFRSLYPSIMRTFNIDPLSWARAPRPFQEHFPQALENPRGPGSAIISAGGRGSEDPAQIDPGQPHSKGLPYIYAPNAARFSRETGILPELLDGYFAARQEALDQGDEIAAHVYKILMNSFYGVLGSPGCIYGRSDLAGAITSFGRMCLLFARDFFRQKGISVLYGDTDSVFIYQAGKDISGLGPGLMHELNAELSRQIDLVYGVESRIQIRFEKAYARFLLPRLRSADPEELVRGRAKGYAGLEARTGELEVKGMESVRSDYTPLAREFQLEVLSRLFSGQKPEELGEYIRGLVMRLKDGQLDEKLVFRKRLRRAAEEYRKSVPPQVRAARLLGWTRERGTLSYVMTLAGPEPLQKLRSKPDYRYYVDQQLSPIWNSIADAAALANRLVEPGLAGSSEDTALWNLRPFESQMELGL